MTSAPPERSWCVVVPHQARGARVARHRLATELAGEVSPALLADVVAVVAELVGNSIRHATPLPGGVVRVAWRHRTEPARDVVEVRVTDGGAGPVGLSGVPRVRQVGPDALDGRGLAIVAALTTRWGVDRDGLGQSVWAELSAPPPTAPGGDPGLLAGLGPVTGP